MGLSYCLFSSATTGVSGRPQKAVHEGGTAGKAEERPGTGQDSPAQSQGSGAFDRSSEERQDGGHKQSKII